MAEQRLAELFEGLSGAIDILTTNVGAQGDGNKIEVYSREPKRFKEWIKSIEKYALLTNADGAQTKHITYEASKSAVLDFIHCYISQLILITLGISLKMNFMLDSQKSKIANMHLPF